MTNPIHIHISPISNAVHFQFFISVRSFQFVFVQHKTVILGIAEYSIFTLLVLTCFRQFIIGAFFNILEWFYGVFRNLCAHGIIITILIESFRWNYCIFEVHLS